MQHPYSEKRAVLATLHQKGELIAPEFLKAFGMVVEEVAVDTDSLGTFSGEIERIGSAREVVLNKARLGIKASGCPRGLASEGSIGADLYIPFIQSDVELIGFVDEELGIELVESFRSTDITAQTTTIDSQSDLSEFLKKADFPHHKVIVRSATKPITYCVKGISTEEVLLSAIADGLRESTSLVVESDLRAHCSPSRAENIKKAAAKMAARLAQLCPDCSAPGWGVTDFIKGLPCAECGEISVDALKSEILGCARCSFTREGKKFAEVIDPSRCDICNP